MRVERTTVDWKNGWLCIKYQSSRLFEPILDTMWWPIRLASQTDCAEWIGLEVAQAVPGCYGCYLDGNWQQFYLTAYEKTRAIASQSDPIPCPKVRKGTRTEWRKGSWHQYTNRNGWTEL